MKNKHQIVMLPTEHKLRLWGLMSNLREVDRLGICRCSPDEHWDKDNWQPQYLYILSDDEIKEGDWHICLDIIKTFPDRCIAYTDKEQLDAIKEDLSISKKIIATTDPKLIHSGKIVDYKGLPQIPQSLVEYYAKHKPEEVELEYEDLSKVWDGYRMPKKVLKLQNNEVVWVNTHKINYDLVEGSKLYTREEVEELCERAMIFGLQEYSEKSIQLEQWFKENL